MINALLMEALVKSTPGSYLLLFLYYERPALAAFAAVLCTFSCVFIQSDGVSYFCISQ